MEKKFDLKPMQKKKNNKNKNKCLVKPFLRYKQLLTLIK